MIEINADNNGRYWLLAVACIGDDCGTAGPPDEEPQGAPVGGAAALLVLGLAALGRTGLAKQR